MIEYPQIDPVAFSIGPITAHWYGIMYLLAFALAYTLLRVRASKHNIFTAQEVSDLIFYSALGVIVGGRLGYFLFYTPFENWLSDPTAIFRIWQGGMSFHGGLLGVIAAMWLWGRYLGRPFFQIMDFCAPVAPLGLALGRLGNFIGNELWGRTAPDVPWAMVFPGAGDIPRHPSQLYQMMLEGFLLFTVLWIVSRKPHPLGMISGLFLVGYGLARFFVEFFREPDAHLAFIALGWVTMGQLLCIPMIILGSAFIYLSPIGKKNA